MHHTQTKNGCIFAKKFAVSACLYVFQVEYLIRKVVEILVTLALYCMAMKFSDLIATS